MSLPCEIHHYYTHTNRTAEERVLMSFRFQLWVNSIVEFAAISCIIFQRHYYYHQPHIVTVHTTCAIVFRRFDTVPFHTIDRWSFGYSAVRLNCLAGGREGEYRIPSKQLQRHIFKIALEYRILIGNQ